MNLTHHTKKVLQTAFDPIEVLKDEVGKGVMEEAVRELGGFFGAGQHFGLKPREIASADLKRAREEQEIIKLENSDAEKSREQAIRIQTTISEYRQHDAKVDAQQNQMKQQFDQLQSEVAQLANTSGVETNVHLENTPHKIGILDLKRLTAIVHQLRAKADESKSAKDLVSTRASSKPATGMLAWVSGKQMKIHEQGTMTLQG